MSNTSTRPQNLWDIDDNLIRLTAQATAVIALLCADCEDAPISTIHRNNCLWLLNDLLKQIEEQHSELFKNEGTGK